MMKSRSKKAMYNGVAGIVYEICLIICGLILPRMILSAFGSRYNGITQSISQFLSFVTLFRAGVGAVTKAALYKPLANNDNLTISRIIRATEIFMRRVALLFVAGLAILAIVYPLLVNKEFELLFAATLVLIIGFSTFA
ncbi:MAG: sugar isomerase, partial [Clostridia bacterium]|nr:sugar isomerase [Clostridia bacterium]